MKMIVGLVAVTALLAGEPGAGAKCARVVLEPELLTHGGDVIPGGGGVLFGYTNSTDYDQASSGDDPSFDASYRFILRKRKIKPSYEQLAPGLGVYRFGKITGTKAVAISMTGAGGKVGAFKARKKTSRPRFSAPGATALTLTVKSGYRWGDEITATVTLDAAPPAEAVALIMYLGDTEKVEPISWANVKGGTSTSVVIFQSRNHCGGNPAGMAAPKAADLVSFAWVDQFGRRSARSAAVKAQ